MQQDYLEVVEEFRGCHGGVDVPQLIVERMLPDDVFSHIDHFAHRHLAYVVTAAVVERWIFLVSMVLLNQ